MIKIALIGAGMRGTHAFGAYALEHSDDVKFVAVAEPDKFKRERFQQAHAIAPECTFHTWEEMLNQPRLADAIIISTPDDLHFKPAIAAIDKGYHLLLEKPMSNSAIECITLGAYPRLEHQVFAVCHVLRYSPFFRALKSLLSQGRIGSLVSIQHNENVGFRHFAHSFVRGNWRNADTSSPMILAKSCHDMDMLLWLANADCESVSSFGELSYFKAEHAPANAKMRCIDDCPAEENCPYSALKHYLGDNLDWLTTTISHDTSINARKNALREGQYGRCVFHCDNNVVDHQVVNLLFTNGVTAVFTMCAFTRDTTRTIKLMGTLGEIRGDMEKNEIEVRDFTNGRCELIYPAVLAEFGGHGGGDNGIMSDFISLIEQEDAQMSLTSAEVSTQSHLMAFAAEHSRLVKAVIHLDTFKEGIKNKLL